MKLTFLGTGSAFTIGQQNYHSNMLLENDEGRTLLIDCGSDVRFSLYEQGLSYQNIHSVYISHLHADHAGGLEWLAFNTKLNPECVKPNLYISKNLVNNLWNHVLKGGLSSIQNTSVELSSFFNPKLIAENDSFIWEGLDFRTVQTIHAMSDFSITPSYGLLFSIKGITVFITTDTQFCYSRYIDIYKLADIIFHDCETNIVKSGIHSHYNDLLTLAPEIKKKIWLYHYNDGPLPNAKKDGFIGFVKKGQCFDFNNPNTFSSSG